MGIGTFTPVYLFNLLLLSTFLNDSNDNICGDCDDCYDSNYINKQFIYEKNVRNCLNRLTDRQLTIEARGYLSANVQHRTARKFGAFTRQSFKNIHGGLNRLMAVVNTQQSLSVCDAKGFAVSTFSQVDAPQRVLICIPCE